MKKTILVSLIGVIASTALISGQALADEYLYRYQIASTSNDDGSTVHDGNTEESINAWREFANIHNFNTGNPEFKDFLENIPNSLPSYTSLPSEWYPLKEANAIEFGSGELTNIDSLASIEKVGKLNLFNNDLDNVDGLSNLNSAGSIFLGSNSLINVNGLSNLKSVNYISLNRNDLENIDGLSNLNSADYIYIDSNDLSNIDGLENLIYVRELHLNTNPLLKNINGIANLSSGKLYLGDYSGSKLPSTSNFCSSNDVKLYMYNNYKLKSEVCL